MSRLEESLREFQKGMAYGLYSTDTELKIGSSGSADFDFEIAERVYKEAKYFVDSITDGGYRYALVAYLNRAGTWELQIDTGRVFNYISRFSNSDSHGFVEKILSNAFENMILEHRRLAQRRNSYSPYNSQYVNFHYQYSGSWEKGLDKVEDVPKVKTPEKCKLCASADCSGEINFLGRCPNREKRLWKAVKSLYWHRYAQQKKELTIV